MKGLLFAVVLVFAGCGGDVISYDVISYVVKITFTDGEVLEYDDQDDCLYGIEYLRLERHGKTNCFLWRSVRHYSIEKRIR